jgi:hypothetical protein
MYQIFLTAWLASSAPTSPDAGPQAVGLNYARRLNLAMRNSASPREVALSTQMLDPDWESSSTEVLQAKSGERLRKAAAGAPGDAVVQYLWSHAGPDGDGCDEENPCPDRRMALARVQPENGAAWLPLIGVAEKARDWQALDAALSKLAASERFDDMYVEAWVAWRDVLRHVPLTEAEFRVAAAGAGFSGRAWSREDIQMSMATANAAAIAIGAGLQNLVHACDRTRYPDASPQRFEDCARAGRMMARTGTSMISEAIGHALVRRAGMQSDADREAERAFKWRRERLVDGYPRSEADAAEWRLYFSDLVATKRESRAQELMLARLGIPLQPPADWQPKSTETGG